MANPQVEDGHIRIANEIWREVRARKFTLNERGVLEAILWYSYGFNLKDAYIPYLKVFSNFGVDLRRATPTLKRLESANVINFLGKGHYEFQKNYELWAVSYNQSSNPEKSTIACIKEVEQLALERRRGVLEETSEKRKSTTEKRKFGGSEKRNRVPTVGTKSFRRSEVDEHISHDQPITNHEEGLPKSGSPGEEPDLAVYIHIKTTHVLSIPEQQRCDAIVAAFGSNYAAIEAAEDFADWFEREKGKAPTKHMIIRRLENIAADKEPQMDAQKAYDAIKDDRSDKQEIDVNKMIREEKEASEGKTAAK